MSIKDEINNYIQNRPIYKKYEQLKDEIDFYRNNVQPMNDFQGNQFRHYVTSALLARDNNIFAPNFAGIAKEVDDVFFRKNNINTSLKDKINDSLFDLKNNFNGSVRGMTLDKNMPRREVYDTLFNELYGVKNDTNSNPPVLYGQVEENVNYKDIDNNKVYTFEEIKKMKPQEFLKNQPKILEAFTTGKMIHENEAKEKVKSGELIYVESYTRQDGTKVSGYYRRR